MSDSGDNRSAPQVMPPFPSSQDRTEARKQNLLRAAARVFARKGFLDGTIPEIARESGVSEASIYDYYSTKEGLLFAIPIEAIKQLEETITFHLKLIRGTPNRLRAMLYLQLLFYKEKRKRSWQHGKDDVQQNVSSPGVYQAY